MKDRAKVPNYIGWGGHRTKKHILREGHRTYFLDWGNNRVGENVYWEGGHRTYFIDWGTMGVGTSHNIQRKNLYGRVGGRVDGWMGGWGIPSGNIATSWLHLASWNLLDSQLC